MWTLFIDLNFGMFQQSLNCFLIAVASCKH